MKNQKRKEKDQDTRKKLSMKLKNATIVKAEENGTSEARFTRFKMDSTNRPPFTLIVFFHSFHKLILKNHKPETPCNT